jgi:hypothetical protein
MAIIKGKPTPGDDNIVADGADDTIDALAGNDTLLGNLGNDLLIGGNGNDNLTSGPGNDTFIGGAGIGQSTGGIATSGLHATPMTMHAAPQSAPITTHPRLFIRSDDLPRLRQWAVDTNPIYKDGLKVIAEEAKKYMDDGVILHPENDKGSNGGERHPTERYAELFAFMSLVSPSQTERDDYSKRAHSLLMYVMNKAKDGPVDGKPFCDPGFSTRDRARWSGEAFALTVDWIYPRLTAADKSTIRTVFLRWIDENLNANTTNHNHPEPSGIVNDPELVKDFERVRWAGNNYYASHMRNIGLMAMALDPADDPDNTLRNYLGNATGAWLYVIDHLLHNDLRGGLPSEGLQYGPQTLSYIAQFLLALQTAGQDDPAVWGQQVVLNNNPFWSNVVPGYLHLLSPRSKEISEEVGRSPVYQPAWYGSALNYWMPDMIDLLAPLALHAQRAGNPAVADPIRWIQTHTPPGGASELVRRVAKPLGGAALESIFYFLLFDPNAPATPDPRAELPLSFTAPGLGRILSRTGWDEDATLFGYMLGWSSTDHQSANGNHIELYRKGEWLFKQRTGYHDFDYLLSDNHNTLALENDPPSHNAPSDWRHHSWKRGSQWQQSLGGDGRIVAQSIQPNYVYVLGDATDLYNARGENSTDVLHASRSVVWLKPDHIVVYDRATTQTANRFKRFWLNLPAQPTINGQRATMLTEGGQKLVVSTLLPANAQIVASLAENEPSNPPAKVEPMKAKLMVQVPGNPKDTRFLHVLQAADAATTADTTQLIQTSAGTPFAGALVGTQVVLFPVSLDTEEVTTLTYTAPAAAQTHMITGLQPNGTYDVAIQVQNNLTRTITIRTGATHTADSGGVLVFTTGQVE